MSKPVFSSLFDTTGRRNRKSYFLYGLVVGPVLYFVSAMMRDGSFPLQLAGLAVGMPLITSALVVGAQRCRDFGWSGWTILLLFIQVVGQVFGVFILLRKGDEGENRYGQDPLTSSDDEPAVAPL